MVDVEWLNYHHLLYFWQVVREGGVARAAQKLRLTHPTVSGQLKTLEAALGEQLLERRGRRLVPTEMGTLVYGYAQEIFALGQELQDALRGRPTGRPARLHVGVAEVVPKLIAKQILEPVQKMTPSVQLVCREDKSEVLLAELAAHALDVVLTDAPVSAGGHVRVFNHLLGECGVSLVGTPALVARFRRGFPASLDGVPMLLPMPVTALRRSLDGWFESLGLRPQVAGEFDDSALLKAFGQDGAGVFAVPTAIEATICRQYGVRRIGLVARVRERYYAISAERRIRHPAVAAICEAARTDLFQAAARRRR